MWKKTNAFLVAQTVIIILLLAAIGFGYIVPNQKIPPIIAVKGIVDISLGEPARITIIGGPSGTSCIGLKCPIGLDASCNGIPCPDNEVELFLLQPFTDQIINSDMPFYYQVILPNGYNYSTQVTYIDSMGSVGTCTGSQIHLAPGVREGSLYLDVFC